MRKTCQLDTLFYKDNNLYMQIRFKNNYQSNIKMSLILVERYTTKVKEYPLTASENNTRVCLSENDLEQITVEGKDWDVFVTFNTDNDNLNERIRLSNSKDLDLLFFHKNGHMLTPFTTNKGNISFKSHLPKLISKVEQIDFNNKKSIEIDGLLVNPLWLEPPSIIKSNLVITHDEENILKIPLQIFDQVSSLTKYNYFLIGYKAAIPIRDLIQISSADIKLEARIEILYSLGDKISSDSSTIVLKFPKFTNKTLVTKMNDKKILITISRTQKARQLNIKINEYNFHYNFKKNIKAKLIYIKRHRIVRDLYKKAFSWIGMLPINKKLVVFESFLGKQFSDNPRAIYEYLQNQQNSYNLYWSVDKKYIHNFQNKNIKYISRFSIKWLFLMPRARFWVTNSRMPVWLPKSKNTIYLQTWHGTPLKRLAVDMEEVHIPGTTAENYKKNFIKEAKNWDYLISPNAYSTEIFRRAFQFDKEIIESGYPRNDFICNFSSTENISKIANDFEIPLNKKVILYAPTWRDNQFYSKGKYRFNLNMNFDLMREKLGEDYVILLRLHYLISENLDLTPYEGFVYDFSNHEDIRELYLLADILITDYSSVFFDYSNLKRPMIFYVYDVEEYRDNLRGFYFDFEQEAPGPLVKTTEEVIQAVKEIEANDFQVFEKFDVFYNRFCYLESGNSTRRVVEKIFLN